MASAKLKVIPAGMKVLELPDGSWALQKKTRRRRRYKMSAKQRKKIAAAARRFKIPVLTAAALAPTALAAAQDFQFGLQQGGVIRGLNGALASILASFTGIVYKIDQNKVEFQPNLMLRGLVPFAGVTLIKKTGILKGAQRQVSRLKLPISLS